MLLAAFFGNRFQKEHRSSKKRGKGRVIGGKKEKSYNVGSFGAIRK